MTKICVVLEKGGGPPHVLKFTVSGVVEREVHKLLSETLRLNFGERVTAMTLVSLDESEPLFSSGGRNG